MNEELSREYNAAVGSLMEARKRYEEACTAHGLESWAAEQAHDDLERQIAHRNQMRERYDAASNAPVIRKDR